MIFVKKYFFTLVQKFWRQKTIFGDFSKMQFLAKNPDYLCRFLVKFSFSKYTLIYFTLLVFKLQQKLFSQNTTKMRGWHHP